MTTTVILDADQKEIRAVARGFLEARYPSDRIRALLETDAGFEPGDWDELAELGWTGIAVDEARGGAGYGMAERCLLMEELGRTLAPLPFLSSAVVASDVLAAAGSEAADALLGRVCDGSLRATVVAFGDLLGGNEPAGDVTAAADGDPGGDAHRLSGRGGLVVDGRSAGLLIAAARRPGGELGLFAVEPGAGGLDRASRPLVDETRRAADVTFDATPAVRIDGPGVESRLRGARDRATVAVAAEMVGGAQRCLEVTLDYLRERQQFGVAIGTFQALKHRVAETFVRIEGAREGVYQAADAVEGGRAADIRPAVSAAKLAVNELYPHVTADAIQLHGGIGFTWEHDVHLYYRRALVSAELLGSSIVHRERLAAELEV